MKKQPSTKLAVEGRKSAASIDKQVKKLLQENSSLKDSNSRLNEQLLHKSKLLNEKKREYSNTFERMFELEQELAFYKIDNIYGREALSERQHDPEEPNSLFLNSPSDQYHP